MPLERPSPSEPVVGIIGGTGPQGRGLGGRLATAGVPVVIGSREVRRAEAVAEQLTAASRTPLRGGENRAVARDADIAIIAVPWDGHAHTVQSLREELRGKVVVDCVNPLGFDKQGPYAIPVPEGSAAEQAQALLPESRVVGAFHHLSAARLADLSIATLDSDVLVLGDDRDATDIVQQLADRIPGLRGVYAGRLRNCRQVEALTANLIAINRRYRAHAGIRVTDI